MTDFYNSGYISLFGKRWTCRAGKISINLTHKDDNGNSYVIYIDAVQDTILSGLLTVRVPKRCNPIYFDRITPYRIDYSDRGFKRVSEFPDMDVFEPQKALLRAYTEGVFLVFESQLRPLLEVR